jgi:hypothetical protein
MNFAIVPTLIDSPESVGIGPGLAFFLAGFFDFFFELNLDLSSGWFCQEV